MKPMLIRVNKRNKEEYLKHLNIFESTVRPCLYMSVKRFWGCDPPVEKRYPAVARGPTVCSVFNQRNINETVFVTVSLSKTFSWSHSIHQHAERTIWGQNEQSGITYCSVLSGVHTFCPQQRKEHDTWEREEKIKKKKKKQYNTASRGASMRIAWAPGLSCLYKQALIFLSSPGTLAIYSQLCGWGPAGVEKFCYSPVGPLRPVCENRFHL